MTRRLTLMCSIAALGAAVVHGGGWASDSGVSGSDAGVDRGASDAVSERTPPVYEDATNVSPFEGWDLFPDYDPTCKFYVPRAAEYLPPPIKWEPCRPNPETGTKSCRQMVFDWDPPKSSPNEWTTPSVTAITNASGRVTLMSARAVDGDRIRFTADVDGPVHTAIRQTATNKCALSEERSDGDYYAYRVYDSEAKGQPSEYGGGAIGGRLDALRPKALKHYHDDWTRGFIAGGPGLLELSRGKMTLNSWADGSFLKDIWSAAQENGLGQNYQFFDQSVLFWQSNTEAISKLKIYTAASGTKDFLGSNVDTSSGVADLGTDGKDLVWLEGSNRLQPSGVFPNVSVVTSPFTTEPGQIQRRVLRTDFSGYSFGTSPFRVGCGYAVRPGSLETATGAKNGTLVVRLSDGYLWYLPSTPEAEWAWAYPLAVTCDEIFVRIRDRAPAAPVAHVNVARVRIDSLGPPTPP